MTFLFVLGREPKISLAELEAIFSSSKVKQIGANLAQVTARTVSLDHQRGTVKVAQIIDQPIQDFLSNLPAGKITLGISDYSEHANPRKTWELALKYKNLLKRHGRNVRLVPNGKSPILSSAASHHNQLGEKTNHIEIVKYGKYTGISIGAQNITAYAKRDQARPARDAFVGMLPPKLAQILINLATAGAKTGTVLDPFCGTGVILQESILMGYSAYGTDLSEKMIDYSRKNLDWITKRTPRLQKPNAPKLHLEPGDATNHKWQLTQPDFVASEIYLGHPLSAPPAEVKLKALQQDAKALLIGFLKNLSSQLPANAQIALATPAWKRPDGSYSGVNILDEIDKLGYNAIKYRYASYDDLLYYREDQIVARQIIVLRKK
jgi:tRNA (guanine10-N2)-dimethyltransferase